MLPIASRYLVRMLQLGQNGLRSLICTICVGGLAARDGERVTAPRVPLDSRGRSKSHSGLHIFLGCGRLGPLLGSTLLLAADGAAQYHNCPWASLHLCTAEIL